MKKQTNKIILILVIFSFIMYISNFLLEKVYHSYDYERIVLENANEVFLQKERLINEYLHKSDYTLKAIKDSETFKSYLITNNTSSISELFMTFMNANKHFQQLTFIDENGNEKIKFERNNIDENVNFITSENLKNVSKIYSFIELESSKKNQVWFSKFDLKKENNTTKEAFIPIVNIMLPIYIDEKYKGLIKINYFVRDLLNKLINEPMFNVILCDELGFIISHYDSKKNWGYYKKEKYNLENEFPKYFSNILESSIYENDKFISKLLKTDLYDNLYMILQANKTYLDKQEINKYKKGYIEIFIFIALSLFLSIVISKLYKNIFINYEEQKEINERFLLASNISGIGFWEFNSKTKEIIWSESVYTIFEINDNLSIDYNYFLSLIPDEDRKKVDKIFYESIKSNREYFIEHKIKLSNGKIKIVQERGIHFSGVTK